jgi:hypothetical protein
MNQNRTTVVGIVALILGFILGVCLGVSLGGQQEVARLREQVNVYEKLVDSYKVELEEINAVLAEPAKGK